MRLDHVPGGVRYKHQYGDKNSHKVESLVTQDDLEMDTIDSQEIVYDDNSSDNSDCQVNSNQEFMFSWVVFSSVMTNFVLVVLNIFAGSCSSSRGGRRTLQWEVRTLAICLILGDKNINPGLLLV